MNESTELDGLPSTVMSPPSTTSTLNFWPHNLISTSINPNTSVAKSGRNSLQWFLRYGVHKFFQTHRLTHSLTDGQTPIQYASSTVFQWWQRHNKTPTRSITGPQHHAICEIFLLTGNNANNANFARYIWHHGEENLAPAPDPSGRVWWQKVYGLLFRYKRLHVLSAVQVRTELVWKQIFVQTGADRTEVLQGRELNWMGPGGTEKKSAETDGDGT